MKKLTLIIFALSAMLVIGGCEKKSTNSNPGSSVANSASSTGAVYDRIMESETIRACYLSYPPACMKDTTSGKLSGTFVEVLEKVAENCGLKVEWTEEVGWGDHIAGLEANRYDIVGSPVWANPTRGKLTTLSKPVYYSGIGIYVRSDDDRFDSDFSKINSKDVKIVTVDGETADLIARTDYPNAERVTLPQLTDISRMFLDVTTKKADVLFAEPYYAYKFLKDNPGSIKNIAADKPIRLLGNCYMFRKGESQLEEMLDTAIEDLQNSGFVDKVIEKYEPAPNTFYRVANPYQVK